MPAHAVPAKAESISNRVMNSQMPEAPSNSDKPLIPQVNQPSEGRPQTDRKTDRRKFRRRKQKAKTRGFVEDAKTAANEQQLQAVIDEEHAKHLQTQIVNVESNANENHTTTLKPSSPPAALSASSQINKANASESEEGWTSVVSKKGRGRKDSANRTRKGVLEAIGACAPIKTSDNVYEKCGWSAECAEESDTDEQCEEPCSERKEAESLYQVLVETKSCVGKEVIAIAIAIESEAEDRSSFHDKTLDGCGMSSGKSVKNYL